MFCNTDRIQGQRNTRDINWNRRKAGGKPFSLGERKRFLSDTKKFTQTSTPNLNKLQQRLGVGNRSIVRPNFIAPDIKPRDPVDFDKMRAVNVAQFGTKVQLSDATIDKLIKFQAPDERDVKWINEKARLVRAGMPNAMPFGRKQRMISKTVNFGMASLTFSEKMAEIKSAVQQGIANSLETRRLLGVRITEVLESGKATSRDILDLKTAIDALNVPAEWNKVFTHQLWTVRQMRDEMYSSIMLYTLSNIGERDINNPVMDARSGRSVPISAPKFSRIARGSKASGNVVYDVQTRTIYDALQVLDDVESGMDAGFLDDLNFKEHNTLGDALRGDFRKQETLQQLRTRLEKAGSIETFEKVGEPEEEEEEVKEGEVSFEL